MSRRRQWVLVAVTVAAGLLFEFFCGMQHGRKLQREAVCDHVTNGQGEVHEKRCYRRDDEGRMVLIEFVGVAK